MLQFSTQSVLQMASTQQLLQQLMTHNWSWEWPSYT